MNRKQLIALAKSHGYDGELDLASIKAWLAQEGIDDIKFAGKSVNLDEAWAKTVTITVDRDAGEDVVVKDASSGGEEPEAGAEEPATDMPEDDAKSLRREIKSLREAVRLSTVKGGHVGRLVHGGDGGPGRYSNMMERKAYNARAARGKASFQDADIAEQFGAWARVTLCPKAAHRTDIEIVGKANIGTTNTSGGALIPMDFLPQLIDLKETRGVARQVVPFSPMSRDSVTLPRRTGGLTAYFPGEAGTITESNPTVDNVTLTAAKMATLTHVSSELINDSALSFGDMVAREIAYAFADKEDEILFNGDGTSTYAGFQGIRHKMLNLTATRANIAGLVVATGNLQSEFVLADYQAVVARLPEYADNGAYWIVHRQHFFGTMMRVALGAGGVTAAEIQQGVASRNYTFLGYPVKFAQVMPRNDTNDVVMALLGNFGFGVKAGEVTGSMSIASDESVGFATDTIAIRGLQRVGINVHDIGNQSATAASRVPGPIVGLLSAAS